jgi:hypothetical protein
VNKDRREEVFEVEEEVLLATKDFDLIQYSSRKCRKLGQKYIGPYKVIEMLAKRVYKLELPKVLTMHPVFHTVQLRKYKELQEFPERLKKQIKTDYTNKNKRKQIVEVKERRVKKERVQYLVK